MKKELEKLEKDFDAEIRIAATQEAIEETRVKYLGRKGGLLTELLRGLKELPDTKKRVMGPIANQLRQKMEGAIEQAQSARTQFAQVPYDLTLPGIKPQRGHLHPRTQALDDLVDVFRSMGFMVYEGPEIENDFYNFEALNFPLGHPARDIQDTFFIKTPITRKEKHNFSKTDWLLRTQTSPMQVRLLEENEPPLRAIVPGRVFRNEATDASHGHTFYQLEGLVVDKDVSVGNLVWTLREIFRQFYQKDVEVRLRPGYFPFVEPGYEMDMSCTFCSRDGSHCKVCKGVGWLEMGGSGMVHQNVLTAAGYEEGKYTGFAFGMGPGRMAMLRNGISDIRLFFENDIRFLEQF